MKRANGKLIEQFLDDWKEGINRNPKSKIGRRSEKRINTLRQKLNFISKLLKENYRISDMVNITPKQIIKLFNDMREGKIKRLDGKNYIAVGDYVKDYKTFFHWYQRIMRQQGKNIEDITIDLDPSKNKPGFVYLSNDDLKKLSNGAIFNHRVLYWFLYDSGARFPGEASRIKVSDFNNDFTQVSIRNEIAKEGSFGRTINLLLCSNLIKEYVKTHNLKSDDYLFNTNFKVANRYLKRLAIKTFGDKMTKARKKMSEIRCYDLRHASACFWLPRYKSVLAMLYRFGWKKEDKIHYYTEMLGMRDTISEDDMLIDTTKTELQQQVEKIEKTYMLTIENMRAEIDDLKDTLSLLGKQR